MQETGRRSDRWCPARQERILRPEPHPLPELGGSQAQRMQGTGKRSDWRPARQERILPLPELGRSQVCLRVHVASKRVDTRREPNPHQQGDTQQQKRPHLKLSRAHAWGRVHVSEICGCPMHRTFDGKLPER